MAQLVKNLPAMQDTWVLSLYWEDPLEKRKATRFSILAWRIHKELDMTERLSFHFTLVNTQVSLEAQTVKNLPAIQKTWVPSLGGENPLEKEMATYSSILAWRIPWMEEPGRL